jgi:predicted lipid-binding transport protein (Tim44 family)
MGGAAAALRAIPAGFDVAGFEKQAKLQFIRMQAAYDAADRTTLAELTTPEMYAEITRELASRGVHRPTEVVTLEAELLEVVTEGGTHWASVRYTGAVKEDGDALAKPVDEAWNLAKPVDGSSGWLLAGIQQYA